MTKDLWALNPHNYLDCQQYVDTPQSYGVQVFQVKGIVNATAYEEM